MNASIGTATPRPESAWIRLRTTVGPVLAGLLGGALAGLIGLPSLAPLCRNMAATCDAFPALPRPWFAFDLDLPVELSLAAVVAGTVALVLTGAAVVWAARPADRWADLSAGLTAALAATLAALVTCVGWPVVLALVTVPSIPDLTFTCEAAAAPSADAAAELARRYPELEAVEPAKRGGLLLARLVTSQAAGAASAAWLGVLGALLTAGSLALIGTLAAGSLQRRGEGLRRAVLPYLEITLPWSVTLALIGWASLSPLLTTLAAERAYASAVPLTGLAAGSALMSVGVSQRWPWLLRVCLALTWLALLGQAMGGAVPWLVTAIATTLTGYLVGRHLGSRPSQAAVTAH
jgi:hypothetical protein